MFACLPEKTSALDKPGESVHPSMVIQLYSQLYPMIPSPVHINLPPHTMVKSREQKMIKKTHMTGTIEWGCN